MTITLQDRPREIARRVKSKYGFDITPDFVKAVLAVLEVGRDMKDQHEQHIHDAAMKDVYGPHGQG